MYQITPVVGTKKLPNRTTVGMTLLLLVSAVTATEPIHSRNPVRKMPRQLSKPCASVATDYRKPHWARDDYRSGETRDVTNASQSNASQRSGPSSGRILGKLSDFNRCA